eukprot:CAMPEP_0202918948 /NCGR_PEP_ID=MMETSP1392-20130828/74606_1 /ASSEMBLY_ACC=CAM_ASM_000868 /TAXON_ID=225041 /ORGANISM="Chlamydomonas chlamydogama, Strain SAG 11-48b" /LENGTH=143 /DNA_ID=CAMNT_0049612137 /DNA_START=243 /DNA_END=674 /DNA_ORIENTATION=+
MEATLLAHSVCFRPAYPCVNHSLDLMDLIRLTDKEPGARPTDRTTDAAAPVASDRSKPPEPCLISSVTMPSSPALASPSLGVASAAMAAAAAAASLSARHGAWNRLPCHVPCRVSSMTTTHSRTTVHVKMAVMILNASMCVKS